MNVPYKIIGIITNRRPNKCKFLKLGKAKKINNFFSSGKRLQNLFITIENIPNTNYLENSKFCLKGKNDILYIPYYTIIMWCRSIYSGQFILIHQKKDDARKYLLQFYEMYIYGTATNLQEKYGF